jgi:putative ABC transport system permease protein
MFIRISPHNTQNTINYIESQWKNFYPDHRFDFAFADDKLQELYTADKRLGALFGTFASLAIIIGCLGLFGLISLTVQNRVKEIGIRKVLGASVINITSLISVDFIKLVIVSLAISSPIAWYVMNKWLQDFAYRINIEWWVFALAGCLAVFIALATLSFQSIKAAMANPVKSLRSE